MLNKKTKDDFYTFLNRPEVTSLRFTFYDISREAGKTGGRAGIHVYEANLSRLADKIMRHARAYITSRRELFEVRNGFGTAIDIMNQWAKEGPGQELPQECVRLSFYRSSWDSDSKEPTIQGPCNSMCTIFSKEFWVDNKLQEDISSPIALLTEEGYAAAVVAGKEATSKAKAILEDYRSHYPESCLLDAPFRLR